jgi:hypothetical protein
MAQNGIVLVVSVSIFRDDEVLMIRENKPTAINKWNFPSGRIENGEDILYSARRESNRSFNFFMFSGMKKPCHFFFPRSLIIKNSSILFSK